MRHERHRPDGRTGSEPTTARSALGLRVALATVYVPLFVVGAVIFGFWASRARPGDSPSPTVLSVLAIVCAVLALLALADYAVVQRRRKAGRGRTRPR
ncbi:DUF6343 family protein [Streptomyces sparsogenes]|uniref:Uncharacterized protein n=1 Tax=Streptomyces sparsogenes DSM 40356 TaxID=1331668 RepID=A0A1R1S929_9ACTN|nr:DUF6343 family protein [Streptomyces sparsogenes]OMI34866.1 hypothetical protein SPAR_34346 [Streptomyces sparsogenes DSM 40356]